uniref:ethanolamine kinase n=1 Tax=Oryctolagus cuniculus TaxID=9986 RepID=G1TM09_RABIT
MRDCVLVRVYGERTELLVDRENEVRNFQLLRAHGCAPKLYCTFQNGLCYEYMQGVALGPEHIREPRLFRLIALEMAKIHTIHTNGSLPKPTLWHKMHNYFTLVRNEINPSLSAGVPKVEVLEWELAWLKEHLSQLDSPVVFCHNDLLCKNIIYDSAKGHVRFIDYEYAGYNYQAFDIGNHFNEFAGISLLLGSLGPHPEPVFHHRLRLPQVRSDPIQPVLQGEASSLGLGDAKVTSLARLPGQLCSPGPALLRGSRPWTRWERGRGGGVRGEGSVPAASPQWLLLKTSFSCWEGRTGPSPPSPGTGGSACSQPGPDPHQHQPALSDGGGGQNRAAPFSEALSSSPPPPPAGPCWGQGGCGDQCPRQLPPARGPVVLPWGQALMVPHGPWRSPASTSSPHSSWGALRAVAYKVIHL